MIASGNLVGDHLFVLLVVVAQSTHLNRRIEVSQAL